MSNCMLCKVWGELTYPFPNFNGWTVEVWKWISKFISHLLMDVITYPCSNTDHTYVAEQWGTCCGSCNPCGWPPDTRTSRSLDWPSWQSPTHSYTSHHLSATDAAPGALRSKCHLPWWSYYGVLCSEDHRHASTTAEGGHHQPLFEFSSQNKGASCMS